MPRNPSKSFILVLAAALVGAAPAFAQQYTGPVAVETAEFGENTFDIGSLTPSTGGLPGDLWQGTQAGDIAFLLDNLPRSYDDPAKLDLLRRTLLSPGAGPDGATSELTAKKLLTLANAGFYEEAASLAELSGGLANRPDLSQAIAYADMLRGDIAQACRRGANLQEGRAEPFWLKLRMICYYANDEMAAADLTLGLLRERGTLMGQEASLFTAMVTGREPDSFDAPVTGFDYVAADLLGAQFTPDQLDGVSGVILRAIANDPDAPKETRAYALHEALYMSIIQPVEAQRLVRTLNLTPEEVAEARVALAERPNNPLTPLIVYQAVSDMSAPEFTIDRAALIGAALQSARSGKEFTVLAKLFAPMANELEVVVNYTPYAAELALAGIVSGNADLAGKWIGALNADQTNSEGSETALMLLELLAMRNERVAARIASASNIELPEPEQAESMETAADLSQPEETEMGEQNLILPMVQIGLQTARTDAQGQAALSWLVLSEVAAAPQSDLAGIRQTLIMDAQSVLEAVDITGELAFEGALDDAVVALAEKRGEVILDVTGNAATDGEYPVASGPAAGVTPRVKPTSND